MWDEICLWYFECSASFFCEMWEKTVISFKWCYLWYENSMRWPPPLVLQQLYIKISLLRDVSIQPHVNVTYFHLKGTTRRRSGHASLPHNVEPQVHRAENRLCRIWCLHGWACEQPSWPFSVFIPQSHQRSLSQSEGGEFAGQRYHFKGEVAEWAGKGRWPPRGAGLIWQLKWDAISRWGVRAAKAD